MTNLHLIYLKMPFAESKSGKYWNSDTKEKKINSWDEVFYYVVVSPLVKRCNHSLNELKSSQSMINNASDWNRPIGYCHYMSLNVVNIFWLFCYYLTLVKRVVIHFNNVKLPSPKIVLYPPYKKLSRLVWTFCVINVPFSLSLCQQFFFLWIYTWPLN